jgi:fatty-acyl-CoA synthase
VRFRHIRGPAWNGVRLIPCNEAAENRFILEAFDCGCLIFQSAYAPLVERILPQLPKISVLVCLHKALPFAVALETWVDGVGDEPVELTPVDDIAMIAGAGGTTGQPKGVMLSGRNLETMSALTLMSYSFEGRLVYLALAPLTHATCVLCFPILALGSRVVIMPKADPTDFLRFIAQRRVTHAFLPPTLIYMLLELRSSLKPTRLRCNASGTAPAPISATRLEEATARSARLWPNCSVRPRRR